MASHSWQFFLILTLIALFIQAYFSMMEMACVSFNKVRLQYYVSKNSKRAQWLSYLLHNPSRLFGTTLIGVNVALQFGSECSRRVYYYLGLSPDWAPLTQVFIVLIFAELAPMFAARRFSEHVSKLGIPLLYLTSIVLTPFIWFLDLICRFFNWILRISVSPMHYLSREELEKAIEGREDMTLAKRGGDFDQVVGNIFSLKNKTAKELMTSIKETQIIPSHYTVEQVKLKLKEAFVPFFPIYHGTHQNVIAIAHLRDFLRLPPLAIVRSFASAPWYITEKSSILQILKQFRVNNQSVAIVLDQNGMTTGVLTLDAIVEEIFGERNFWIPLTDLVIEKSKIMIERSFPGSTPVKEINEKYHIALPHKNDETLEELMIEILGHKPAMDESVRIDAYELKVEDASLIAGRIIQIKG